MLKAKAKGHRDLVTVVGSLPSVSAGGWVTAQGRRVQDKEFGLQFKAERLTSTAPTTREGIEKYLGSGMVKGIGPVYAKKLVEAFGETLASNPTARPTWTSSTNSDAPRSAVTPPKRASSPRATACSTLK